MSDPVPDGRGYRATPVPATRRHRSFPQELRIGCNREMATRFASVMLLEGIAQERFYPVSAADGYGGFIHNHRETAVEVHGDIFGCRTQIGKIGAAIWQRRSTNRDKDYMCMGNRLGIGRSEADIRA